MCLAVCGTIVSIASGATTLQSLDPDDALWRMAVVDFGGVRQQVSLACLPEARIGDRVLVHVGLALSLVHSEDEPTPVSGDGI